MSTKYSYSRLDTYFKCPLKYKFRYIDGIKPETEGVEAFMGSRVHDALEKLYKDKQMKKEITLEQLLHHYGEIWQKNWHENIQIVKKEYSAENYLQVGRQAIEDYYNRYKPFDGGKIVGLEYKLMIDLNGDKKYCLTGVIDRLVVKDGGYYEIHDYKTSNKLPTQEEFDNDKQLALYQLGVESAWKDAKEIDLVWHYLRFDKEFRSKRKAEDLDKLRAEVMEQIDTVERAVAEEAFSPCGGPLCSWCDYQELCPKRKHFVKVEPLPPNEYLKEDGVTLVNKYVELKEEKKEIVDEKDEELAKIEEALVQLAKEHGYETVKGCDYQVKINFGPRLGFPTKTRDEELRNALEELVKKFGIWEKVCDMSTKKLSTAMQSDGLSEEQIKELKKYLIVDDKPKLSLSKLKQFD